MKSLKKLLLTVFAIGLASYFSTVQSQIQFEGLYSQGEGAASWNADGSGPETAATGHVNPLTSTASTFYISSRDYVTQNSNHAGFHFLPGLIGFPNFLQSLIDNGFTPEQVKVKVGLGTYEEDIEGVDWLTIGNDYYANHYNMSLSFELEGEPLLSGNLYYLNHTRAGTATYWYVNSSYCEIEDASTGGIASDVATAFLNDLAGTEIQIYFEMTVAESFTNINGRTGYYFNLLNGTITNGNPSIPFIGLASEHQGTIAWDANGTGPEPKRDGHQNFGYYGSSRDYDGIDPDPNAAFGHFLDNSEGFTNFYLQLEYRGYTTDQLKLKSNACTLGEDIEGEDWFGPDTLNYYHGIMRVELNGEPLIGFVHDTLNFIYQGTEWIIRATPGIVYNASENSSSDVQLIADAFFKDLESRQLSSVFEMSYVSSIPSVNGRSGAFYQITDGLAIAKESNCTRVYEGPVSGTWNASCSPYIIEGEITVPAGETLIIEPGVWVKFTDLYPVKVQGSIEANGLSTNTGGIVFTAVNPSKGWDGFDMENTANSESIAFNNCIFEYGFANGADGFCSGGAIAASNFDNIAIDHCIFRNNWASLIQGDYKGSGGAIALDNCDITISNSKFYNNYVVFTGGAIVCYGESNVDIDRCLFHNNTSDLDGGAIEIWGSSPIITNCTFSLNHAANYGGAFDIYDYSDPNILNCIFWGNTAGKYNKISIYSNDCNPNITYNDLSGGESGMGPYGIGSNGSYENNIDEDPVFVEPLGWDFHLSDPSPCINAGDPSIFDPDGTISDMGAFYYSIPNAPIAFEGVTLSDVSFKAIWQLNFDVNGYLLDVASDENFNNIVTGYESLDVGLINHYEVIVPEPDIYYYRLRAYNAAGPSEPSNVIYVLLVNTEEFLTEYSAGSVSICPNPVSNNGKIILELETASDVRIEILSFTGQRLFVESLEKNQGLLNIPLDLSSLLPGSYMCRITLDNSTHTTKFIKY